MKIDGRTLRGRINRWVKINHPGKRPVFTVKTVVERERKMFGSLYATLEVRLDDANQDAMDLHEGIRDYVIEGWWPSHKKSMTTFVQYSVGGGNRVKRHLSVERIDVITGFTH